MIGGPGSATRSDVVEMLMLAYATPSPGLTIAAIRCVVKPPPTDAERAEAEEGFRSAVAATRRGMMSDSDATIGAGGGRRGS